MEKVDILVATCNGEKYVKEQIDSILNQTYENIRVIVSDDRSDDSTPKILKEIAKSDKRVILNLQKDRLGVINNFEFLLKQVKSNFYMFSDQDDFWLPNKVEKMMERQKQENADLVFGDLEVVNENLETMYPSYGDYMLLNRKIKKCINSYEYNYLYNCVTGCTILGKTSMLDKILPLPNTSKYVLHDHWIGIITGIYGKVAYVEETYIKYRQHGNNQVGTDKISHKFTKFSDVRELFLKIKIEIFQTFVDNNDRFPKEIQEKNTKALKYYKMLENKKYFNFKNWNIFYDLYKNETFKYYIENFMVFNMPLLSSGIFKVRHFILKIQGKR